jgi:hypothetical protein
MKKIMLAAVIAIAATSMARASEVPSVATNVITWTPEAVAKYKLTQEMCHNHSIETLNRAHAEGLSVMTSSVFGAIDGVGVTIRCSFSENNRAVFFVTTGEFEALGPVMKKVQAAWDNEKPEKRQSKKKDQDI